MSVASIPGTSDTLVSLLQGQLEHRLGVSRGGFDVSLASMNHEDMMRLWDGFDLPYQLSVSYLVRTVRLAHPLELLRCQLQVPGQPQRRRLKLRWRGGCGWGRQGRCLANFVGPR